MKKAVLDKSIDKAIRIKMMAVDRLIEDLITPLEIKDNPEDLLGKPYAQWTPQDLELLKRVYGIGDDTVLTRFIFKKTYERVKALEGEEL